MYLDEQGNLWIYSINRENQDVHYHRYKNGILSLFEVPNFSWWNGAFGMYHDQNQRTWFLNFGNGVAMHDPGDGEFHYFRPTDCIVTLYSVSWKTMREIYGWDRAEMD